MGFERGEIVEWIVEDKGQLVLRRTPVPPSAMKKNCRVSMHFRRSGGTMSAFGGTQDLWGTVGGWRSAPWLAVLGPRGAVDDNLWTPSVRLVG
ncbi:MAG: hypothetical protein IPF82_17180 [Blastocatellia bacterium]|nr:hypothetical protein [Blastocatellia bacterium]